MDLGKKPKVAVRYLEADQVKLPSRAPVFVDEGHCQWCNKKLTGKATRYCRPTKEEKGDYGASGCAIDFLNWWCSRPAYVRATFVRDNFTCRECGLHPMREDKPWLPDISLLECDHIIPISKVGYTEMENLQTLCRRCNRRKGIKVDEGKDYPQVVPSRDKTRCPSCGGSGYRVLPWHPPEHFDPEMIKVECLSCGGISYIAPLPYQLGNNKRRK